ncbi:uncharacterized protein LOC128990292 [Macrosteles quadrilineatus]|nr:uncharacterized protein LOC128990292 [Macrosteles quadrilineatus]
MDLVMQGRTGIKLSKETKNQEGTYSFKTRENCQDISMEDNNVIENIPETSEEYTHKIKTTFDPLLKKILEPLKAKSFRKILYQNCLIDSLIRHKSFCPPIDVEQLSESQALELMSLLEDLWKEIIEGLQANDILHCLLKQLILHEDQLMSSQLWLRLVSQLIAGHPPPHPPGTLEVSQMVIEALPTAVKPEVLKIRVNLLHMRYNKPMELKSASADELHVLQELGRRVLDHPTRFTTQYLHSLLSLWEPRMSWETREKLCALARIYNGQQPLRNPPTQVYTSASFLGEQEEKEEVMSTESADSQSSPWTLYTGDADWSQSALGALPQ